MKTSISIIDQEGSKISDETNVQLLWAAMLMGESVITYCQATMPLIALLEFDKCNRREKVVIYLDWQKSNPEVTEEMVSQIERLYSVILRCDNMKRKTREVIVAQAKAEKVLQTLFDDFKKYMLDYCQLSHTSSFLTLASVDEKHWDKPLLPLDFTIKDTLSGVNSSIVTVLNTLTDSSWFPFFDSPIKNHFKSVPLEGGMIDSNVDFIYDFLIEIPEPVTLNTSQINLVRNDFSKYSMNLFTEMTSLNERLEKIRFDGDHTEEIKSLYLDKISQIKTLFQKVVNESICLNELRKENPDDKMYRVYAGIGSFNILLELYKSLDIITQRDVLYISEHLSLEGVISNSRIFLFLDVV